MQDKSCTLILRASPARARARKRTRAREVYTIRVWKHTKSRFNVANAT